MSHNISYNSNLKVVCEMEGIDCVSLDVLRQYPENEPSDIKCFESGYLKRYCDLTLIEDVIIWCKAIYMNGSSYCDKIS